MEKVMINLITFGVPVLLLYIIKFLSHETDIYLTLAMIYNHFGGRGVLAISLLLGLISNIFSKAAIEHLLLKFCQKRSQFMPEQKLIEKIDRLPISTDLKIKLKWSFLHQDFSWRSNFKNLIPWAFILAVISATLLTFTGYLGQLHYLLEMTSHFKLQYLVVGLCTLFFFLLTRRQKWAIVSLICIVINLGEIVPWYLPQWGNNSAIASQIRILQSNVLWNNKNYPQVISLVKEEKPDIVVFLEVSKIWMKELTALKDSFPYSFTNQDSTDMGTAIYSKIPLENPAIQNLGGGRKTLVTDLKVKGQIVTLVASHLSIPTSKASFYLRNKQLVELTDFVKEIKHPMVALGDWNITMWSPFYQRFVQKTALKNARYGFGILPSWPTTFPLLSIPIDQSLLSPEIKVVNIHTGRKVGSDHLPVIQDLAIPAS